MGRRSPAQFERATVLGLAERTDCAEERKAQAHVPMPSDRW